MKKVKRIIYCLITLVPLILLIILSMVFWVFNCRKVHEAIWDKVESIGQYAERWEN